MVEHLIVDQEATGSSPVRRPSSPFLSGKMMIDYYYKMVRHSFYST